MSKEKTTGRKKPFEPIEIDLKSNENFKEEIKEILNEHPDWYLGTWFYRTWRKTDLGIGLADESLHVVAFFYPREECVPIDRADDLRWGLAKP